MEDHKGHTIVKDKFASLPGVKRFPTGDQYCLTCQSPVEEKNITE